jgi:general secretion pathway protein D
MPLPGPIRWLALAASLALLSPALAQHPAPAPRPDPHKAEEYYRRAARLLAAGRLDEAAAALDRSAALDPFQPGYLTAREFVRQQRITSFLARGEEFMSQGRTVEAAASFRAALELDPANEYALQRFQDAAGLRSRQPVVVLDPPAYAVEPELAPRPGPQSFDFRGDGRRLFETIARAYGLTAVFDEAFAARPLRFRLEHVDFAVALATARRMTRSFIVPLSSTQFLVATDSVDNRRKLERLALRTFYLPGASGPQELQELSNLLRTMFDIRFLSLNNAASTLTVRAPARVLEAAERVLSGLGAGPPEILLDLHIYQLSDTGAKQYGLSLPLQFTAFNLATEARALSNSPGVQDLINRLTAGGQLSDAEVAALAAVLASQQNPDSPLLRPFATFGGGTTLSGLNIPPLGLRLDLNQSVFSDRKHVMLRAQQGKAASLHIGDRFPVLTAIFSPVLNLPITPQAAQSQNLQPLAPSFQYEDLGISLKATPQVTGAGDVILQFELTLKGLAGSSLNGIPTITNREYKGTITARDGQPSVIAGSMDRTEQAGLQGMPWVSRLPVLGAAAGTRSRSFSGSQILFVITPRVVRQRRDRDAAVEAYLDPS